MLELKKRPKSPYWVARGTIQGRRVEVSTKCAKLADAKARLPAIIAELSADPDAEEQTAFTFSKAVKVYEAQKPGARYLEALIRHFGEMPVALINNAEMRRAANILYPAAAPSTIRRQLYTPMKAVLNCAAEEDLCSAPRLKSPVGGNKRTVFLVPSEAEALLSALSNDINEFLMPMVTFLLGQGCRMGETVSLEARDVNLESRFAILRDTKNGEERRVTLISRVVEALAGLPTLGEEGPLFRRCDGLGFRHGGDSGGQIAKAFGRAAKAAGLDPSRITPHVCRHTWATWFYAQTKDVRRLQDEGGWKSGEWQRYTKIGTPDLGRVALRKGWDFRDDVRGKSGGRKPKGLTPQGVLVPC